MSSGPWWQPARAQKSEIKTDVELAGCLRERAELFSSSADKLKVEEKEAPVE